MYDTQKERYIPVFTIIEKSDFHIKQKLQFQMTRNTGINTI